MFPGSDRPLHHHPRIPIRTMPLHPPASASPHPQCLIPTRGMSISSSSYGFLFLFLYQMTYGGFVSPVHSQARVTVCVPSPCQGSLGRVPCSVPHPGAVWTLGRPCVLRLGAAVRPRLPSPFTLLP